MSSVAGDRTLFGLMPMLRQLTLLLLLCGAPLLVGCSKEKLPEIGKVQGVLTAKGKPLKDMIVTFMPEPSEGHEIPINARAMTDAQGHYELKFGFKDESGSGAPVGIHRVVIQDTRYASLGQGAPMPPRLFSTRYSSAGTTPLKVEVKPGEQTINLEVTL